MTPITTATNTAGPPITVGSDPIAIAITPLVALAAPSGLAATLAGPVSGPPSGVALTWTDNATAPAVTLVRVERASDPEFTVGVTDVTAGAAATSYTDTAVVEGATYYYRVRAENDGIKSAWSNPVSITFTTVPAAPAGLAATVTGPVSGPPAGVTLTWTNTTGAALVTHMVVRRATDPGFTTGLADFPLGAAATSYTDTSVAEGTTYYYRVRAENEASLSAWSNTVSVTFTTVPAAPSGLAATLTGSSVSLAWTVNASTCPATQLRIERSTDPGFTTNVTSTLAGPALSSYTDTTVAQGTNYYYRVRAENEISTSAWSNTVSVWVPDVISATGPGDQSSVAGEHVQLPPIQATSSTGLPLTFSASGLPAGLSIDPNTGVISGTVTTAGSYTPTVTITDTSGASASAGFTWTVHADTISVTSPGSQSTYIGFPASLQIHASSGAGLPLSYSATGLPPGSASPARGSSPAPPQDRRAVTRPW